MLERLLAVCDERYQDTQSCEPCEECGYGSFCPHNCEKCLDIIHTPSHAPSGAPSRKYDCNRMADFYVCKYTCRYTSEMIYAFRRLREIKNKASLKVLSLGCGPCTDLLALDYLKTHGELSFTSLEYRGVDYSRDVWEHTHEDIQRLRPQEVTVKFYYQNICEFINEIGRGAWIPDLVTFQYFLSDLHKHSGGQATTQFLKTFAQFVNDYMPSGAYIVLNDTNLGTGYGGGRDYFNNLVEMLNECSFRRGRFRNDKSRNFYYPHGYPYGEDSDGEFPCNRNFFSLSRWSRYSPFDTCASAQMLIKNGVSMG